MLPQEFLCLYIWYQNFKYICWVLGRWIHGYILFPAIFHGCRVGPSVAWVEVWCFLCYRWKNEEYKYIGFLRRSWLICIRHTGLSKKWNLFSHGHIRKIWYIFNRHLQTLRNSAHYSPITFSSDSQSSLWFDVFICRVGSAGYMSKLLGILKTLSVCFQINCLVTFVFTNLTNLGCKGKNSLSADKIEGSG